MSTTHELHEKIQLQTQDVKYLQRIFLENAHSKLNLHLPITNNSKDDPLRNKIENMVETFIFETFEMARHSMIIDGIDMSNTASLKNIIDEPKEQIEPFNFELNDKLRKIYAQVEDATLEVTSLRRELPIKAKEEYGKLLTQYDEKINKVIQDLNNHHNDINEEIEDIPKIDNILPRLNDMKLDYEKSLSILVDLKEEIPKQTSQMEKLNELIQFIEKIATNSN
ncbi:hypothetical protein PACTADRAFT_18178 [Pachysolen tannophilus NRRL Y-2460]|uniref:Uncharacterized protein n=1 Tax=Pachysolen tannophilus NRRL Y-2460 TaxID=669874 RepID=A0A1E4TRU6_PACTA|nr:hypothetical protein PACTADRAFT_18178 [Pachysolen tannophilus NRRL Y-2460]